LQHFNAGREGYAERYCEEKATDRGTNARKGEVCSESERHIKAEVNDDVCDEAPIEIARVSGQQDQERVGYAGICLKRPRVE
jgi:hypothetical protein